MFYALFKNGILNPYFFIDGNLKSNKLFAYILGILTKVNNHSRLFLSIKTHNKYIKPNNPANIPLKNNSKPVILGFLEEL